jgi:hypothetical protein
MAAVSVNATATVNGRRAASPTTCSPVSAFPKVRAP